ncbi:MAG: sodium:calcium antiporter [Halobacteria archaeon]
MLIPLAEYTVLAVVATAVLWKASDTLESSSEHLSRYYALPTIVQGSIVTAVGSSFPELSSTVISTLLHGKFDLGVGAIVGSAIFNILVIPAVAVLIHGEVDTDKEVVYKDAQFYMLSVAALLIVFSLAVIYYPVPGKELIGKINRPLALIPVVLYVLYVFIQYAEVRDHAAEPETSVNAVKQWLLLAASLVVILIAVEGLVKAAIGFGDLFNTPSYLWGLTVIAAGTSLPDAFVSIKSAGKDKGVQSLANVIGSNIFDLLIAIPAGVLIAGTATVNFRAAVPMMGYLVFSTVVMFTFLRTDLKLTRKESYGMLFIYFIFIAAIGYTVLFV